ncbi:MAG: hypothetical protein QMB94_08885, partial [Phycisphaerales bacterium]
MNSLVIFLACFLCGSPGVMIDAGDAGPAISAEAAATMESLRKRYQTAPGMTLLANARWADSAGHVVRMERA